MVSYLLQQRSPAHLDAQLLSALEQLHRAVLPVAGLAQAVRQQLLLNLRLWSRAPAESQVQLLSLMERLAKVFQF